MAAASSSDPIGKVVLLSFLTGVRRRWCPLRGCGDGEFTVRNPRRRGPMSSPGPAASSPVVPQWVQCEMEVASVHQLVLRFLVDKGWFPVVCILRALQDMLTSLVCLDQKRDLPIAYLVNIH